MFSIDLRSGLTLPVLAVLLSALLWVIAFHCSMFFVLPWFGLVPFLWALQRTSVAGAYGFGLLFGFILFLGITYWIAPFFSKINDWPLIAAFFLVGLYWFFCAQIFALLAMLLRLLQPRWVGAQWWALPVLGTVAFHQFPWVFAGDLSLTQSQFLLALQGLDITGALGLHFLILLHNGLVFSALCSPSRSRQDRLGRVIAWSLIACWFIYGVWSLQVWRAVEQSAPIVNVGLVQLNEPPSVALPETEPGYTRAQSPALALSKLLAEGGAELIVWPEMRYVGFEHPHVRAALQDFVDREQVALLIQGLLPESVEATEPLRTEIYNSSVLLTPSGPELQVYRKGRLIPFGEHLPLPQHWWVSQTLLNKLFDGFFTPLSPGIENRAMSWQGPLFQPLICYETAHPDYVRQLFSAQDPAPQWLVVQTNDGWFGPSLQPRLHAVTGQFRGVELRRPVVHLINNGPSVYSGASGDRLFQSAADTRAAYLIEVRVPELASATWYSKYPLGFIGLVYGLMALLLISVSRDLVCRKPRSLSAHAGL